MRGDIYRLASDRSAVGREQQGFRYAVEIQSDMIRLSTMIVAPTSTSARPAVFRPEIVMDTGGRQTKTLILADQMAAVDVSRLGEFAGRLEQDELADLDHAVRLILGLL
jgi:mRNA interferase MazF